MLEMDEGRLDYVEQLRPPDGYELNYAVATTYSLHLDALLGVCLSLADRDFSGDPTGVNRVNLFASIEKMSNRLAVFCEKGRIKNDERTKNLCVLMEGMINQVVVEKPSSKASAIASFHPKVWILDYRSAHDKTHLYRFMVLSRNLTLSGSWDVAVCMDGYDTGKAVPESRSISAFLDYLRRTEGVECGEDTALRIRRLSKALTTVRFEIDSGLFDGFEFLPFGPQKGPRDSRLRDASAAGLFTDSFDRALVVSPFLGNTGPLARLCENRTPRGRQSGDFILVSRREALEGLSASLSSAFTLCEPKAWLADIEIENEDCDASQDAVAADYSDLHAKIYLTENSDGRNLYLGSLNASCNGMRGNVEALVRFHFKKRKGLFSDIVAALIGAGKPFEQLPEAFSAVAAPADDNSLIEFDRVFYAAAKLFSFGSVVVVKDIDGQFGISGTYEFDMADDLKDSRLSFSIAPYLAHRATMPLSQGRFAFSGLHASQLSEFFVFSCCGPDNFSRACLLRCPDELFDDVVLNADARTRLVLERILDADENALESYIAYIFGMPSGGPSAAKVASGTNGSSLASGSIAPGMYEHLMRSLSDDDEALKRLEYARWMLDFLPEKYSDEQIAAMKDLVDTFESAVRHRG